MRLFDCLTEPHDSESVHFMDTSGASNLFKARFRYGGFMNILAAVKREERRLEKQVGKLQDQLDGVRAAARALGNSAGKEVTTVKKRVLSAAGRAKIAKAAKKRWAKLRAQAKKAAS
jgi:hypothetical protein